MLYRKTEILGVLSKYERICPLSSRILQKRTRIFKYVVFFKSVFVVFYKIVLKRKYAYKECFVTILKVLQRKRHNFVNESYLLIWGKLQLGLIR